MTTQTRKAVISLLEIAHGYAIAGHYMPFRMAVLEEKASDEVRELAKNAIDEQLRARHIPDHEKPAANVYADAIGDAIGRVERG